MIKNIAIILLMCVSTSLIGQRNFEYEDFYKNQWKVPYNWTKQDTLILKRSQKDISQRIEFGVFISFNENREVTYEHFMDCLVGETLIDIKTFFISKNKAYIYYETKPWDIIPSKWKKKYKKYRILKYDDTTMMLVRV